MAGTLVFPAAPAGSVQFKSITVPACADNAFEIRPEHFTVRLSQPDFVHLADGDGTGAIM